MRILLLLSLATAGTGNAIAQAPIPPADSLAIMSAIDRWFEAWEAGDAALAARDYAEDADWTNAFGQTQRGRAAIEGQIREVFALGFVVAGQSEAIGQEMRLVAPDIALVTTRVERRGQRTESGEDLGVRRTTHLRVFERRRGAWVIVSHLISDARDMGGPRH